jgi:hypothetical protein
LNPHGVLAHRNLNPARLPVPPLSRIVKSSTYNVLGLKRGPIVVVFVVVGEGILSLNRIQDLSNLLKVARANDVVPFKH